MELEAGNVEIGEIIVLRFDLHVAGGEILVLPLHAGHMFQKTLFFAFQLGYPLRKFPALLGLILARVVCSQPLFQLDQTVPEQFVLFQEFLGELSPFLEKLQELLSPPRNAFFLISRHCALLSASIPARPAAGHDFFGNLLQWHDCIHHAGGNGRPRHTENNRRLL